MNEEQFAYLSALNTAVELVWCGADLLLDVPDDIATTARTIIEETENSSGCEFSYNDGVVTVFDTDCAFVEALAKIFQATLKKFAIDLPIVIEYANYCDNHRAGGFSGGVVVVTASEEHWMSTSQWGEEVVKKLQSVRELEKIGSPEICMETSTPFRIIGSQ
jgi:hypothetical protein